MAQPCDGIRVLDLTRGYAAITGMVLADYGADVVRVVRPGGGDRPADPLEAMPANRQWQRGKRAVAADLTVAADRQAVHRLVAGCDVVLENFRPRAAVRLGVDWDTLRAVNPGLVQLSITGFGPGGRYADVKAYEGVVAAACGQCTIQNGYRDGPIFDAVAKGAFGSAMLGLVGVLAALRERDRSGRGQQVRTSLVQSLFVYSYDGLRHPDPAVTRRMSLVQGRDPHNDAPGYRIARCADDRWIQSGSFGPGIFENFIRALEIDEYFTDPRFGPGVWSLGDAERRDLIDRIDRAYATRPHDDWVRRFEEMDAAYGVFLTTQQFMDYPQMVHNGHVVTVDDPAVGEMRQIGPLATVGTGGWAWPGPAADPSSADPAGQMDWRSRPAGPDGATLDGAAGGRDPEAGPLAGVRVLDLAMYAAAPGGPGLLADLGADVVKVEPPAGDPVSRTGGELFVRMTRSKRRVAVDLKDPRGQQVLHDLVAGADVVVHNFRPGVPERLGVDFETLAKVNDRLVYVYGAAFGSSGPDARRPAFDPVISAMAGGEVLQAGRGNPPQQRQTADHSALLGVGVAILLGLRQRDRTGDAVLVETTMLCSAAYLFSDDFLDYPAKPPRPEPDAGQHGLDARYRLYRTADGWVFLACPRDDEWRRAAAVLGIDPDGALAADGALADVVAAAFARRPTAAWVDDLGAVDVACVPADGTWGDFLYGPADRVHSADSGAVDAADPDAAAVDPALVVEYELPDIGKVLHTGGAIDLSATPGRLGRLEGLGESTEAVLAEAGISRDRIAELADAGVVVVPPLPPARLSVT